MVNLNMKRIVDEYDFKVLGDLIKEPRKARRISGNQLAGKMNISPRYSAFIENSEQHPSLHLQIFYELVTFLDISLDQFFYS